MFIFKCNLRKSVWNQSIRDIQLAVDYTDLSTCDTCDANDSFRILDRNCVSFTSVPDMSRNVCSYWPFLAIFIVTSRWVKAATVDQFSWFCSISFMLSGWRVLPSVFSATRRKYAGRPRFYYGSIHKEKKPILKSCELNEPRPVR